MSFLQLISTIASIISIPLAVYYAHKTADATSDKARLEIIKTLSYKLSIERKILYDDIVAVYYSKLREHKIKKAKFDIVDIIHDLRSEIMSNAFINNSTRSEMLLNLSLISDLAYNKHETEIISPFEHIYMIFSKALSPIFVILIIVNVNLLLLHLPTFIYLVYETIHPSYSLIDTTIVTWTSFFYDSNLYISLICLIAWAILLVAHKCSVANNRRL